jgi:hypothetical protein
MKINTQTIKKIIKEELDCVIKEFKMPDIIPTPESMGFERIVIDPSFESKAKEMLSNVDVKGLREFLKQNFPMEALTLKESIEKNLPRRKRTAGEIITETVQIMKADRMWQENFDQNIEELIQISKEDPSQKELIDEWVKIFIFEKSKTWFDKNIPTIKAFIEKYQKYMKAFFGFMVAYSTFWMVCFIAAYLFETMMIVGTLGIGWEREVTLDWFIEGILLKTLVYLDSPLIVLVLIIVEAILPEPEKNNEND